LSSLFDVPAQLALVLTLAASTAGPRGPGAHAVHAPAANASFEIIAPETAEGPYRFAAANWFRALCEDPAVAAAVDANGVIFRTSGGRYYVPAASERKRLLAKRYEPELARRAARSFAEHNAQRLGIALRRAPTAGDLYIAHVLGPENAIAFIERAEAEPTAVARKRMPELAHAVPSLVGSEQHPLTLAQLYRKLTLPLASAPHGPDLAMAASAHSDGRPEVKPTLAQVAQRAREALAPAGATGEGAKGWWPDVAAAGTGVRPQ
jgi:hypothetical protein